MSAAVDEGSLLETSLPEDPPVSDAPLLLDVSEPSVLKRVPGPPALGRIE